MISTARSAPIASAFRSASIARSGPIETTTTSPSPDASLSFNASSTGYVSHSEIVSSPERSSRFVEGSRCRWEAASGTAFTQTAIFMGADSIHASRVGIARTRGYGVPMPRLLPLLGVLALACVCATASHAARGGVPQLLFPVVGSVDYHDDFGEPRGGLRHQGKTCSATSARQSCGREGTVKCWTTSSRRRLHALPLRREAVDVQYIH